jgi:methylated-DNA-[protein]-cysteine S-methyltransferase
VGQAEGVLEDSADTTARAAGPARPILASWSGMTLLGAETPTYTTTLDSPIGPLALTSRDGFITGLYMQDQNHAPAGTDGWLADPSPFEQAREQVLAYFSGELTQFDLPLRLDGTAFQRRVWEGLGAIPYGQTISYGELARRIGNPKACRAVGLASGRNPVAVIVPCHRLIGADGTLTGFGGGLDRKRWLLEHEAAHPRP